MSLSHLKNKKKRKDRSDIILPNNDRNKQHERAYNLPLGESDRRIADYWNLYFFPKGCYVFLKGRDIFTFPIVLKTYWFLSFLRYFLSYFYDFFVFGFFPLPPSFVLFFVFCFLFHLIFLYVSISGNRMSSNCSSQFFLCNQPITFYLDQVWR